MPQLLTPRLACFFLVLLQPTTRRVVVDGFRVDEVPDSKVVEVEEEQTFALRPEPVGPNEIKSTRDLGRLQNPHSHLPDAPYGTQPDGTPLAQSGYRGTVYGQQPQQFGSSQGFNRTVPRNGAAPASAFNAPPANPLESLRAYGLGVDESVTRAHTHARAHTERRCFECRWIDVCCSRC